MSEAAQTLLAEGYQARREHRLADARGLFAAAAATSRESGEPPTMLARALEGAGQIESDLGGGEAALELYRQAVELYRAHGTALELAHCVRHVGDILRRLQRAEESAACYEEALTIYRREEQVPLLDLANAARGFALLEEQRGRAAEAVGLWRQAIQLYRQTGIEAGVAEGERRIAQLTA
jgi:tetratricopeptide (TPR) repeat protein